MIGGVNSRPTWNRQANRRHFVFFPTANAIEILFAMFEQEINDTIQRLTRDVLQEQTVLPLSEILEESRIPDRFKAFFATEAHWWIFTESVARSRDRRFDFAHPELGALVSYLEQVQFRHARFERDDFVAVLDSAVKLTYNYLCRPQTTLKWYVFRGEPTKSIGETLLRMDAFIDYPYFRTVFAEWVDRKKEERPTFDSISAREFERIIRRIDDQILLSCTIDDLLGLMTPLFDFVGRGDAQSLPIEAMIVFFDDKNIRKLVDFLERERQGRAHVSRNSFVALMEELLNTSDDEPEADFSSVYQDDALDEVVREHLEGGQGTVEESAAREMARPAGGSLNGGIVMTTGAPERGSPPDEEDRWEEERNEVPVEYAEAGDGGASGRDDDEMEIDRSSYASVEEDHAYTAGDASYNVEIAEESVAEADEDDHADDDETRAFFLDADEGGDPILDLLIETADEGPITDVSRGERENTEDWVEVREVEEMRHPYDDETVDEVIEAVEEVRSEMALAAGESETEETAVDEPTESGEASITDTAVHDFDRTAVHEEMEADAEEVQPRHEPGGETAEAEEQEAKTSGEEADRDGEGDDDDDENESDEFHLADEPIRASMAPVETEEADARSRPDDVRNYIDAMLERKVVKKIFNRNRDNYEQTLDLLNGAGTWREASRILDELFIRYDVDPYSRIAIRFTDSVYGRYLSPVYGG